LAKKKKAQEWLQMPKLHSKFNDKALESILIKKAVDLLTVEGETPAFIFLSGGFFDVKGFAYSALRAWRGAAKPSESGRRPLLEATFASISVYISSLLSLQSDFYFCRFISLDQVKLVQAYINRIWEKPYIVEKFKLLI